ncbi:tryptophan-rich sensory protein [Amnibacterium sp. CER49]|uniref:TspO/MBR family protein n=1 Tax=Amnibacterium sp. CER49 TaxID=3039161 RepID=UPI00244BB8AD|nr:tryptophan-rich sensory protein [Amnibacterium sp. CER49]MDH2443498.1 tryptophan-rich sensory protein [Amnibacterium sp. CER49]
MTDVSPTATMVAMGVEPEAGLSGAGDSYVLADAAPHAPYRPSGAVLLRFLAAAALLSLLGAATTTPLISEWFTSGPRMAAEPRVWVFLVVWTAVYFADAIAGWLIWRAGFTRQVRAALRLHLTQLVLQAVWLIAFALQAPVRGALLGVVFGILLVLDIATLAAAVSAWRASRWATVILGGVLVWLLYGTVLSFGDTVLRSLSAG